ncbi:UPF0481 protein At3g47200-like [Diospyros lotus]|uniref:UPF0481 protein At3g47200-like n=1 Tax=Diospyros lotus TaxID=55363 RepID=UPI00225126D1|nr:UPF0481 protein At3g47200-like [Diospyros lotus]
MGTEFQPLPSHGRRNDAKHATRSHTDAAVIKIGEGRAPPSTGSISSGPIYRVPEDLPKPNGSPYTARSVSNGSPHRQYESAMAAQSQRTPSHGRKDAKTQMSSRSEAIKGNDSKPGGSHAITIKEIKAARKAKSQYAVIQKVPEELRKLKESAYAPRVVSIGPIHSDDDRLKLNGMTIKKCYVNDIFGRIAKATDEKKSHVLKRCREEMGKLASEASKFYAEHGDLVTEDMLVIDGCFILELLYRSYEYCRMLDENPRSKDPIFNGGLRRYGLQHDLLLLENQLPFFVLERLFIFTEKARPNPSLESLECYVLSYFHDVMFLEEDSKFEPSESDPDEKRKKEDEGMKVNHILHLLHRHYIDLQNSKKDVGKIVLMNTAQDLDFAGVKFVPRTEVRKYPFDVEFREPEGFKWLFHRASFEIPTLKINNSTEVVLRNLIAFEQCSPGISSLVVTSYAYLMDRLVNTAKDVRVLSEAGVLFNYLGADEEASDLFNKLCREVVLEDFQFAKTCKKADDYSKCWWPKARAHMKRKYFANPCTCIAFCVAFLVFGITVATFVRNMLR